jgi:hypothetical protein
MNGKPTHGNTLLTPEEYLELDRKAEYRSEYYANTSRWHTTKCISNTAFASPTIDGCSRLIRNRAESVVLPSINIEF